MKLTVAKLTHKQNGNGNWVITLEERLQSMSTPLGTTPGGVASKYCIEVDAPSVQLGQEIEIDLSMFNIVPRTFTVDDANSPKFGQEVSVNWLQAK